MPAVKAVEKMFSTVLKSMVDIETTKFATKCAFLHSFPFIRKWHFGKSLNNTTLMKFLRFQIFCKMVGLPW